MMHIKMCKTPEEVRTKVNSISRDFILIPLIETSRARKLSQVFGNWLSLTFSIKRRLFCVFHASIFLRATLDTFLLADLKG